MSIRSSQWARPTLLLLSSALLLTGLACSGKEDPQDPEAGCSQDADCPGDMICQQSTCQAPAQEDMGSPQDMDSDDGEPDAGYDAGPDLAPEDMDPAPDMDAGPEDMGPDLVEPEDMADLPEDVADASDLADAVEDEPDMEAPDLPLEPRPEQLEGGVVLYEANIRVNFVIGPRLADIRAAFVEPEEGIEPEVPEQIGPCQITQVTTEEEAEPFGYDAGDIEVLVGERAPATLRPDLREDGAWIYGSPFADSQVAVDDVFDPMDEISIRSRGGRHIRGFEASLGAPEDHQVLSPAPAESIGGGALTVTWSGAMSQQEVLLSIAPLNNSYGFVAGTGLQCQLEGDPGELTIPAEAMARLSGPKLLVLVTKVQNVHFEAGEDSFVLNTTLANGNIVDYQP